MPGGLKFCFILYQQSLQTSPSISTHTLGSGLALLPIHENMYESTNGFDVSHTALENSDLIRNARFAQLIDSESKFYY